MVYYKFFLNLIKIKFTENVDIRCFELQNAERNNERYEITHSGPDIKQFFKIFDTEKSLKEGKYLAKRMVELVNFPYGTCFGDMVLFNYFLFLHSLTSFLSFFFSSFLYK